MGLFGGLDVKFLDAMPMKYVGKDGAEHYMWVAIVDEKKLGKGPSLLVAGDPYEGVADAISFGMEVRYEQILAHTYDRKEKKGEFEITKKDFIDLGEDEDKLDYAKIYGFEMMRRIFESKSARSYLKKHFEGVSYQQDSPNELPIPKKGNNYEQTFLEYEVYEGIFKKNWNQYKVPVEGIARIWKRYVPLESKELSELAETTLSLDSKNEINQYRNSAKDIMKRLIKEM